jgi:hypothetical protein
VQLGAAHDDALICAPHDPHVEVRIVLLMGAAATVALGVGDHLGRAQVVVADMVI